MVEVECKLSGSFDVGAEIMHRHNNASVTLRRSEEAPEHEVIIQLTGAEPVVVSIAELEDALRAVRKPLYDPKA